ncbi:MAG: hypothetical protein LBR50_04815 [Tannerella sp.]|jgi:signal transduction histidine kinase|nr:hypothetical protein [Tannerella sp.]
MSLAPASGKITVSFDVERHCGENRNEESGQVIKITVADSGCGIPHEKLEKIFGKTTCNCAICL